VRGKGIFQIRYALVIRFACSGATQRFDFAGSTITDQYILDRMAFLLAAGELALALVVLWPLNGTLDSIDTELQPGALSKHLRDIGCFSRWELLFEAQGLIQNRRETMNPVAGLRLT
jgi:hypothetical protein